MYRYMQMIVCNQLTWKMNGTHCYDEHSSTDTYVTSAQTLEECLEILSQDIRGMFAVVNHQSRLSAGKNFARKTVNGTAPFVDCQLLFREAEQQFNKTEIPQKLFSNRGVILHDVYF